MGVTTRPEPSISAVVLTADTAERRTYDYVTRVSYRRCYELGLGELL
jgi:hypothetical protein